MKSTVIIAILCITALEITAMLCGVDGAVFGIAIAAISGLGGYQIHKKRTEAKEK